MVLQVYENGQFYVRYRTYPIYNGMPSRNKQYIQVDSAVRRRSNGQICTYSVRKLLTGLAVAALRAWKLMVKSARQITAKATIANTHQSMLIR